MNEQIRDS